MNKVSDDLLNVENKNLDGGGEPILDIQRKPDNFADEIFLNLTEMRNKLNDI